MKFQSNTLTYKYWFLGQCFQDNIAFWGDFIQDNTTLRGDFITQLHADNEYHCQVACYEEPECNVWSYHKLHEKCYLKTTVGNDIRSHDNYISGLKTCDGEYT